MRLFNDLYERFVRKIDGGFVPPFDHPEIWAGHSTLIDENDSFDSFGDGNPSAVGSGSMELIEFSFGGKAAVEGDVFFDFADDGRFSRRREAARR